MGRPTMQFQHTLANGAASSTKARSDVTTFSSMAATIRELRKALVKENDLVYDVERLCMCMTLLAVQRPGTDPNCNGLPSRTASLKARQETRPAAA